MRNVNAEKAWREGSGAGGANKGKGVCGGDVGKAKGGDEDVRDTVGGM